MPHNIILKNFKSGRYSRRGFLRTPVMWADAASYVKKYDIKHGGLELPVALMSGGNQQKLLFAREVSGQPRLIVATYPVRGVDIGAAEAIRSILREQSENGAAILFISEDLEDIFGFCDRIGVLCDGELMGIRRVEETDMQEIGRMMSGERGDSE